MKMVQQQIHMMHSDTCQETDKRQVDMVIRYNETDKLSVTLVFNNIVNSNCSEKLKLDMHLFISGSMSMTFSRVILVPDFAYQGMRINDTAVPIKFAGKYWNQLFGRKKFSTS
jgi:hypothetical protein